MHYLQVLTVDIQCRHSEVAVIIILGLIILVAAVIVGVSQAF